MPWKAAAVSDLRLALVHQVRLLHTPVARAARDFGISRKTAYKWLARADADTALQDHARRPRSSPQALERQKPQAATRLLALRDQYGWGGRKLAALLRAEGLDPPAVRTVTRLLGRHHRIRPTPPEPADCQHFERANPHELWQMDFKGPLHVARRTAYPLAVIDDHSRFCLCLRLMRTRDQGRVFDVLWDVFGEFGLPEAFLCDNEFAMTFPTNSGRVISRQFRLASNASGLR